MTTSLSLPRQCPSCQLPVPLQPHDQTFDQHPGNRLGCPQCHTVAPRNAFQPVGVAIDWYAERRCGARYAGFCIPRTHETEGMAAPESVTHRHLLHMRGDNPRASTITEHSPRLRVCHRLDLRELAKTDGRAISDAKIAWAVALLCEQEAILPCHDPMGASTGESHLAQENLHGDFGLPDSNTASHPEHIAGWHTISSIRCSASLETITHAYRFIGFTAAEQQAVNERMIAANFPRQRRAA